MSGLAGEFFAGRGAFFGIGGGLLHDRIDLLQANADLIDSLGLFAAGGGDFGDQVGDLGNGTDNFIQCG